MSSIVNEFIFLTSVDCKLILIQGQHGTGKQYLCKTLVQFNSSQNEIHSMHASEVYEHLGKFSSAKQTWIIQTHDCSPLQIKELQHIIITNNRVKESTLNFIVCIQPEISIPDTLFKHAQWIVTMQIDHDVKVLHNQTQHLSIIPAAIIQVLKISGEIMSKAHQYEQQQQQQQMMEQGYEESITTFHSNHCMFSDANHNLNNSIIGGSTRTSSSSSVSSSVVEYHSIIQNTVSQLLFQSKL